MSREGTAVNIPKFSPNALLKINLALGLFVTLTNGSAFVLTVSGGRSHLGGQLGEVALWALAGIVLLALSVIGLSKASSVTAILESQVVVVFGLVTALAAWGLAVASGAYRVEGAFVWSVGLLSFLGLYGYVLYANVTTIRGWGRGLRPLAIAIVAACIVVDIAAFFR